MIVQIISSAIEMSHCHLPNNAARSATHGSMIVMTECFMGSIAILNRTSELYKFSSLLLEIGSCKSGPRST
jgi:hypothetical protein